MKTPKNGDDTVNTLPDVVPYHGSRKALWNTIPLGVSNEGEECWNINAYHHALIVGAPGTGRASIEREIIYHAIQHPSRLTVTGVDIRGICLQECDGYSNVRPCSETLEDTLTMFKHLQAEKMIRHVMSDNSNQQDGVGGGFTQKAIIVLLEEPVYKLKSQNGAKREDVENMRAEICDIILDLIHSGGASQIHVALCLDAIEDLLNTHYGSDIMETMTFKVLLGKTDSTNSLLTLGSTSGAETPNGVKGRGIISRNGVETRFQTYWACRDWLERNNIMP